MRAFINFKTFNKDVLKFIATILQRASLKKSILLKEKLKDGFKIKVESYAKEKN